MWLGYAVSSLMIIPLVIYGMKLLSKLQLWTTPFWLVLSGANRTTRPPGRQGMERLREVPGPSPTGDGHRRGEGEHVPATADDFSRWARPHWSSMVRLARRLAPAGSGGGSDGSVAADWEDVLQEALGAAWRKWDQYDAERGTPRAWLLAIVADQARKGHRRRRPEPVDHQRAEDEGLLRAAAGGTSSGTDHASVSALDVERALSRLTPRQRLTVDLHYFVDLPVAECAAVLGCAEGTVKSTLSDARGRLRAELAEDYR